MKQFETLVIIIFYKKIIVTSNNQWRIKIKIWKDKNPWQLKFDVLVNSLTYYNRDLWRKKKKKKDQIPTGKRERKKNRRMSYNLNWKTNIKVNSKE